MILKMCARCKTPVLYPAIYCDSCQVITDQLREERLKSRKKQYNKRYDKNTRDKRSDQFYHSPAWKALAARYMQDHCYTCEECGKVATQVHHKIEIKTPEGWDLRFEYSNLRALCDKCHNKAHGRFGG